MTKPPLPDCPKCDCNGTLTPVRGDGHGTIVAECSACNAVVRISASGQIVHEDGTQGKNNRRRLD